MSARLIPLLSFLALPLLSAAPAGKSQQITSPDQVPQGLAKSDWAGIRAAYESGRHAFHRHEDGTHVARNPGQGWGMRFDVSGFTVTPEDSAWSWGLEMVDTEPSVAAEVRDGRLSYQRSTAVTEWFINDGRGLEQGWTLSAPAEIRLRVRGSLKAEVTAQSICFGSEVTYSGLRAWDADGKNVPVCFEATTEGFAVRYEDAAARYPITIDPIAQQVYLKASNTGAEDRFGSGVAISGDTVLISARNEDSAATGVDGNQADNTATDSGAAYIFVRNAGVWTQQAYLKASNTGANDWFGWRVALSGDTAVVTAYQEASNATGVNAPVTGGSGTQADNSIAGAGAVYVFVRNGTNWTQQAYLKASNATSNDLFGWSAAISGDTIVVGAIQDDSNASGVNGDEADNSMSNAGSAFIFTRSGTTWTQQAYLKASNPAAMDTFGHSVACSGDTVVVGASFEDSGATGVNGNQADGSSANSGAAYVFVRSGTTWWQQAYLKASNTGADDRFGDNMALDGDTLVVSGFQEDSNATGINAAVSGGSGTQADNSSLNSGAVYVFTRSGGGWSQQAYVKASNTGSVDLFGSALSISGDLMLIGAYLEDSSASGIGGNQALNNLNNAGAAYLFSRSGTTWTQRSYIKSSNPGNLDAFGLAVALSGDTAVISALLEDSNDTGVGGNQADNSATDAGAAYIFTGLIPVPPVLTTVSPALGSTNGSTNVTLTGTGFTGATSVSFDGVDATNLVVVNDTTITCRTPTNTTGDASVIVTTPDGSNDANTLYTYVPPPTLSSLSPSVGLVTGGTSITITGVNFTGATAVTFTGTAATSFTVDNDTTITCVSPARSAGAADVIVTTPYGSSDALSFTYGSLPVVSGVSPGVGSTSGGNIVTVTGSNFTGTTSVTFGGMPVASFTVANATTLNCTTPARGPGLVNVIVTNAFGSGTGTNLYTFANPPVVSLVNAAGGSTAGGTVVSIHGSGFTGASAVTFGGTAATNVTVNNDTRITATTPVGAAGLVNVVVSAFGMSGTGTGLYRYAPASSSTDTDGDGLNDAAELYLSAFGFDPGTAQAAQVTSFLAGNVLFNLAQFDTNRTTGRNDVINDPNPYDLYTTSQVEALHFPTPLIKHNPATGVFTLTLGVQKSTTLMPGSFQPFSMTTAPDAVRTFNSEGKLEFQFTSPENAAFFRLEAR